MKISKLFMTLPEAYACTPDGMEIDRYGNLILSCPNYADEQEHQTTFLRVDLS